MNVILKTQILDNKDKEILWILNENKPLNLICFVKSIFKKCINARILYLIIRI